MSINFSDEQVISDVASRVYSIFSADIDDDGDLDIVAAINGENTVAWYENDGNSNFTQRTISDTTTGALAVLVADIDSDGNLDVVASSRKNQIVWFQQDNSGNFTERIVTKTFNNTNSVFSLSSSDIDNDGDLDIISASAYSYAGNLTWYENDGAGNFTEHTIFAPETRPSDLQPWQVSSIDIDSDNDIDILAVFKGRMGGAKISWYENDGNANFEEHIIVENLTNNGGRSESAFLVDLDADGDIDFISQSLTGLGISWYENDGEENFTENLVDDNQLYYVEPKSIDVVDFDRDGDLDILVSSQVNPARTLLFENDGNNNFQKHLVAINEKAIFSSSFSDIDGDGDIDIVSASRDDNKIALLVNLECFLTGTLVTTTQGPRPVETLQIGDLIQTADGKTQPIKWIGTQTFDAAKHPAHPFRTYPIRIQAGALGHNLPSRPLYVSPDHALLIDGLLINAGAITNGTTITQIPMEQFTYYHIELEHHALLLAEGTPAESYLPQNQARDSFDNGAEYDQFYPNHNILSLLPMHYPRVSSKRQLPRFVAKRLQKISEILSSDGILTA